MNTVRWRSGSALVSNPVYRNQKTKVTGSNPVLIARSVAIRVSILVSRRTNEVCSEV